MLVPPAEFTLEEIERCVRILESIVGDRASLAQVPEPLRIKLIAAAGRASRPTRIEFLKLSNELRALHKQKREERDRLARASTVIRQARAAAVFTAPPRLMPPREERAARELEKPRYCYICKSEYRRLHFFYDALCPDCGDFNYEKRHQTADLAGTAAVVTGARLKIGYQASLMLLRAGASVVATTRFPCDAALRYSREPDFDKWACRLQIHGLDLRHTPSVEIFARYLNGTRERLDFLINNAAQTVRRPPAFYAHLLAGEDRSRELPPRLAGLLRSHHDCLSMLSRQRPALPVAAAENPDPTGLVAWHAGTPGIGLAASARLSQLKYAYDDAELGRDIFPGGKYDADLQQVDLREKNSWRLTLSEVPTAEMLELQLINSVAPFVLCAKLKPLMLRDRSFAKHIVNVSAMEGVFSRRTKTDKHPHTNMAKAALNMLTLTSAPDYVKDGIHMNAVDTGWVTDEDPAQHVARKVTELDFQPPLDIVDGAARILDPIFSGFLTGNHLWGQFLKDYRPSSW